MKFSISLSLLVLFQTLSLAQYSTKVSIGSAAVIGDLTFPTDPLNSAEITVKRDLRSNLGLHVTLGLYRSSGYSEGELWYPAVLGGGLVEGVYDVYQDSPWLPSFANTTANISIGANAKLPIVKEKLHLVIGAGLGVGFSSTQLDLLDFLEEPYVIELPIQTTGGRDLEDVYNGIFETEFDPLPSVMPMLQTEIGVAYNLTKTLQVTVDFKRYFTNTDFIDGIRWKTSEIETSGNDGIQFIGVGLCKALIFEQIEDLDDEDILEEN